jgi:hypothetical protein
MTDKTHLPRRIWERLPSVGAMYEKSQPTSIHRSHARDSDLSQFAPGKHAIFASHMSSAGQVDDRVNAGKTLGVIELSEQAVIEQLVDRLASRYPAIAQSIVASVVIETHARFDDRPVRDFIPLLVERDAKSELARLGAAVGSAMPVP